MDLKVILEERFNLFSYFNLLTNRRRSPSKEVTEERENNAHAQVHSHIQNIYIQPPKHKRTCIHKTISTIKRLMHTHGALVRLNITNI